MSSSSKNEEFFDVPESDCKAFFWIRKVDLEGFPVQLQFVEAAYKKARYFKTYRASELQDTSVRASIVEDAVYKASRAKPPGEILSTRAYLVTTVTRGIDYRIKLDSRIVFRGRNNPTGHTDPSELEDRIFQRQLLDKMPLDDRLVWEERLLGEKVLDIAANLGVSADTLSARMRRSIAELKKRLVVLDREGDGE